MSLRNLSFDELVELASYETDAEKREDLVREINERCERQERGISWEDRFDIFAGTPKEDAAWLETVVGLDQAKGRIQSIASQSPGFYFIFHASSQRVLRQLDNGPRKLKDKQQPLKTRTG